MGVRSVSNSNLLMLTERDSWAGIETDNYDFIIYPLTARALMSSGCLILFCGSQRARWGGAENWNILFGLFKSSDITVNIHWIKI